MALPRIRIGCDALVGERISCDRRRSKAKLGKPPLIESGFLVVEFQRKDPRTALRRESARQAVAERRSHLPDAVGNPGVAS